MTSAIHALRGAGSSPRPWRARLAGIDDTVTLRAALTIISASGHAEFQLDSAAVPPTPGELLRLELVEGRPLNHPSAVSDTWHCPPYAVAVRLAHYLPYTETPVILDEAVIGTRGSQSEYRMRLEATAMQLVRDAAAGTSRGPLGGQLPSMPRPHLARRAEGWLRRALARCGEKVFSEWWSLGVSHHSLCEIVRRGELGSVQWLQPKPGPTYLADPFPWPGTPHVLCEEMPMAGGYGRIVALTPQANGRSLCTTDVLESDHHHSYPCVFQEGDESYLLPEASERGQTVLYRLGIGAALVPMCRVAPVRRLADATLFKHDGRYWIACTDLDIGAHDNLCLLHAERLCGPWQSHRLTPVKIDVRGARPAGSIFSVGGDLIRPAQDCAQTYGAAVTLNRVERLTRDEYRETPFLKIKPDRNGPFPHGLHTLTSDGVHTWIDGKRFILHLPSILTKAARRISAPLGKGRSTAS
jgi:hypothetical protein